MKGNGNVPGQHNFPSSESTWAEHTHVKVLGCPSDRWATLLNPLIVFNNPVIPRINEAFMVEHRLYAVALDEGVWLCFDGVRV